MEIYLQRGDDGSQTFYFRDEFTHETIQKDLREHTIPYMNKDRTIYFDLSGVTKGDSTFVGALVDICINRKDCQIYLIGVPKEIRSHIEISHLENVLLIDENPSRAAA